MSYGILYKYIACSHYKDDWIMYQGQKYFERHILSPPALSPHFRRKNPLFVGKLIGFGFCSADYEKIQNYMEQREAKLIYVLRA